MEGKARVYNRDETEKELKLAIDRKREGSRMRQEVKWQEAKCPALYRREEIPGKLKISQRAVDDLIATGELASLKIGKRRLISEAALAAFVRKAELAAK